MTIRDESGKPRPAVDPDVYDLASHLLREEPGATEDDIWALARAFQEQYEDACREIECRDKKSEDG